MPPSTTREILQAVAASAAEWLFAMLPLVVVAIVIAQFKPFAEFLTSPEWTFGAAVLAAQALVRFVGGVARSGGASIERVLLGLALILVGVVGPTNVVLVLVLSAEYHRQPVPWGLRIAQVVLFCLSSAVFIALAAASHIWTERALGRTTPANNAS